jgi:rod shape-determining protein MreD
MSLMKTLNKNSFATICHVINKNWRYTQYFLVSVFLLFLSTIPVWSVPEIHLNFYLFALYFGSLYFSHFISLESIFTIGLLQDTIYGYPLGMSGLKYLCLHGLLLSQSRYLSERNIVLSWLGFATFCFLDTILQWVLLSYITDHLPSYSFIFPSAILTIFFYPMGLKLLYWISKKIG